MKLEYKLLPCWPGPQFTSFHFFPLSGLQYKMTGNALRGARQGYFFWLQNTEGEFVVGGWLQIHQLQVLSVFCSQKKEP
jgi:hypothetical protein